MSTNELYCNKCSICVILVERVLLKISNGCWIINQVVDVIDVIGARNAGRLILTFKTGICFRLHVNSLMLSNYKDMIEHM